MVVTLSQSQKERLPEGIINQLSESPYNFNPSLVKLNEISFLAIRSYNPHLKKIEAIIYIYNGQEELKKISLTDFFLGISNIPYVADPKLFILDNEVWGTFNTGFIANGNNTIVLFKLADLKIEEYYFCFLNDRIRIEKNWAFYKENGALKVLYSVNPLITLVESSRSDNTIYFEKECVFSHKKYKAYSIGTPLCYDGKNYLFMAHKKIVFRGKRLYLGRSFIFSPNTAPRIKGEKKFLFHSLKSLWGDKHKFNRNLISCTYFSAIYIEKNKVILGYGINDTSWNLVKIDRNKIWS